MTRPFILMKVTTQKMKIFHFSIYLEIYNTQFAKYNTQFENEPSSCQATKPSVQAWLT
uniref:Uncharacterized protein n=1 Tax=Rhizophora mucronata TaxID=61149 RepID=A0A2P2P9A8_RHIMU